MAQQKMYAPKVNSPFTELSSAIDAVQTTISVVDGTVLPDGPNLATLGTDENAETILYQTKVGNDLSGITRGFQGTAKSWAQGSSIARLFTAYDLSSLQQNHEETQQELTTHKAEDATESQKGHIQIASAAEVTSGTDTTKAITPLNLKTELDKKISVSEKGQPGGVAKLDASGLLPKNQLPIEEYELIQEITILSETQEVTFVNLSQYKKIFIETYLKTLTSGSNTAASDLLIFLNGINSIIMNTATILSGSSPTFTINPTSFIPNGIGADAGTFQDYATGFIYVSNIKDEPKKLMYRNTSRTSTSETPSQWEGTGLLYIGDLIDSITLRASATGARAMNHGSIKIRGVRR